MRGDEVRANEQQKQPGQQAQPSWAEKLSQWVQDNHAQQPALGAEMAAIGREMVKDVRATLMETYSGKPEHASEPGTPLSPTMQEVSVGRGVVGQYQATLDAYAARGSVYGNEQEKGIER